MRRKKKGVKRLDFLPNRQNKYSIRKFTIGTASILVGATLVFGIPKEAKAAEENTTQTDNISTSDEAVDSEPNVDNTTQTPTTEPTSEEMNTDTTTPSSTEPTTNEQPSTEEPAPSDDTNASVDVTEDPSTDASTKEAPTQPSDATEASNESEATTETSEPDTTEEASTEEQSAETAQPETETTEEPPQEKEEADKTETNSTEEEATKEQSTSESNTTEEATTEEKTQETDTTSDSDAKTDASNKESNASTEEASPETTTTKDTDAPQTSLENDLPASNTDKESDSMTLNSGSNTSLMQALESVDAQEKQQATEDYLAQYLTPEESKQLINNTTINFENATTQEINDAILHEAAQNLANEMDQNEALATSSDIVRPIAPLSMQMNSTNYDSTFQSAMTLEEPNRPSYTIPDDPNYLYLLRDLGYNATTVKDKTDLRFAGIGQLGDQKTSEINLNLTKWLSYKSEFTDGGKVHLSFSQPEFFSQIDKITINGVDMTTTNNGQDWSAPISGSTVNSGLIGVVTNSPVKITLKNNQTLESLGYSEDNPVYMTHTWTTNKGEIAAESIQQTTITPTLNSKAPQQTQTSNFVSGRIVNSLRYDQTDNAIRSIHSFKPDENFLQTDYDWLLYIKEQVPEALIPYIDPNKIQIYVSDEYGNKRWDSTYVDITMDQNGLVDTSKIPSLSIMQNNTLSQIGKARLALDSNVFYGALGQSRNYTISYGLKDGVTMSEIARNINEESLTSTDARTQFSSWLESDYLDSRVFGKQDGGSAHKRIYGSYASSYIDFFDYDGDGVPDIADTTPDVNNDDPIAPDAPVINPIEAESTSITGTGESGSKVTVTFKDNTTATSTVDSNGQWTVNVPNGTTLNHNDTLSATLTDAAKNTSTATTATVKDTVAPNAVTINPVVTSDTTVTGANGEPGSTVTVTFPGGTTTTSTVGDHGNWEVNIPDTVTLNENDTVTATAQDKAGNQSSESTVNVTGIPVPDEPTLDAIEAGAQQISGKGEAGNTVTVTLPDQTQHTATVGDDGVWTIDVPDTVTLNHEDVVSARQNNGQQDSGDTTAIVRDTVAPNAPLIHDIEAGVTKITGQGENGSTITVSFPDGATANAVVDDEGNWTIDVPLDTPLPTLGEDITATSTDKAGNESQVSTKAVQDTTAPEAPGVLPIELGETTINGTGEPGATVEVTFKDGTIGTAEVGENGNWTLEGTADNLQLNDKIEVTQKDASQNVSHATTVMVHDTTAPDAPNVNPIEAASTEVTGTGEPNALIALQLPDGSVVEATANENGDWTADISTLPVLKDGDTVEVTQRDAAMNTSTATTVTVEDTIAPDAPTINPVTSKDRQVKGTAEPNSTVVITFPNNQNATVEATEEGLFTVDFPEDLELTGGETIKAIAKDSAGNESEQSTTTVEDLTAPEPPVIASVNSTDTTINGTAEPGSKVSLTIDGETIGDAVEADQNGAFTFDIPNTLNGGEVIKATATDQNNNVSDETTTVVTDTTQPDVPTINPINSEDRTITGQAEANGTVTIELPEGETLEGTADENGNYTIDLPDTVDFKGGETIRASVKDEAGNVSPQTEMIVKDTTPPTTPTLNEITSEDTSISGTGEAGSTVTLTFPDGTTATGTVNDEGQYDIAIPEGIDLQGTEVISAESRDAAQNVSSNTTTTVKDVTPPAQPTIDEVTSNSIEISGTAEPNSKVTIVISDGTLIETNTNASGQYRENISDIGPFAGNESIEVTAIDAAGNTSEKATTTVIDKTPPDAPNVDAIQSTDNTIKGTAEPNSTVTVRFPDQSTQTATANEQGAFEFDITNQNLSGEEELVFTAKDESGNVSNPSSVVVADTTAPEVPTVDEVTSDATSIKGTGEAGSTVTVAFPGGQTSTGTVHEDGSYDLLIPGDVDLTGGEELQVTSTDKAGNESDAGTVTVTDTTAPAAPTVDEVTSESPSIKGTGEPGSTINVTLNGEQLGEPVEVGEDGNYEVIIPEGTDLTGGEELQVTSTDKAGNESEAGTVTVTDTTAPEAPTVDEVTSDSPSIKGTGEPGSTINVTLNGEQLGEPVEVGEDGNYEVMIPEGTDLTGGEELQVTSTDEAGNTSEAGTVTVTDTTAPEAPTVDEVTSDSPSIKGTGEPGSTINVTLNGEQLGEPVEVGEDGSYEVVIPEGTDLTGGEELQVTSTDQAGNTSEVSSTTVTDTTAPAAPTVDEVTSDSPSIKGTGEPGSTINVTLNGEQLGDPVEVGEDGNYEVVIPEGTDLTGGEELQVTSTDKAGNTSEAGTVTVKDTTAPAAPTVDEVTSESPSIKGTGEPGSTINVTLNGEQLGEPVEVGEDGNYEVMIPEGTDLTGGEELQVTSTDEAGNTSEAGTVTVTDTTAPTAPTVDEVTSDSPSIKGTGEPGSTINVTLNGEQLGEPVEVGEDGNYEVVIPEGTDLTGGEELQVTSTDKAGNESDAETVTVKDTTAPEAPTVDEVTSDSPSIKGTGEPGSTINVTLNGEQLGEPVEVGEDGNYEVVIPEGTDLTGGEELQVTSTDKAGNVSDAGTVTVTDTTAPTAPTVDEVTSDSPSIKGTGEPGSTINVTLNGEQLGEPVEVGEDGSYEVVIPEGTDLTGGEELQVTSTDQAGNTSEASSTTVTDTTAPEAPTVDEVTSDSSSIKGTGEPGSTINVTLNGEQLGEPVEVGEDGNYEVMIPEGTDLTGGEELQVTSTDQAGNTSDAGTVTVTDTTAPSAPTVDEVTSESPSIKGTGEPGSTIKVTLNGEQLGEPVEVGEDGNYEVVIPEGTDLTGGETLEVTSTDKAGNTSEVTSTTVTDTTAPTAPTVNEVTSDSPSIKGTGEPGSTINVTLNGEQLGEPVEVGEDGNYEVMIPEGTDLTGGETLEVTSTDKAGNTSEASSTTVTDTTAPEAPTVDEVTSDSSSIKGTGEPGSTINVTLNGEQLGEPVEVGEDGNYEVMIPEGTDLTGGEELQVTSTDQAGNTSDAGTVTVTDTTAPSAPTVDEVTSESPSIKGTGEPGSTIKVTLNGEQLGEPVEVGEDGNYEVVIPEGTDLTGGETLEVTSTDKDGNVSEVTSVTVKDTTAPTAPTVDEVTSDSSSIKGTGEPGSTVTVTFPNGDTATGTVNKDGRFEISIPSGTQLDGNEEINVTITDAAGNSSDTISVKVISTKEDLPISNSNSENQTNANSNVKNNDSQHQSESASNSFNENDSQKVSPSVVTGMGDPGSTVTVVLPDGSVYTGLVDNNGNYSVELPSGIGVINQNNVTVAITNPSGQTVKDENAEIHHNELTVLPETGQSSSQKGTLLGGAFAMLGSFFLLFRRRNKKDKENHQ